MGVVLGAIALLALGSFIAGVVSAPVITGPVLLALAAASFGALIPLLAAFLAGALLFAIGFVINDLLQCFVFSNLPLPSPPRPPGQPLTAVPSCDAARKNLGEARAAAALAEQDVAAQAAQVRRAQDQLAAARSALTAATLAVGASLILPWLLIPAIAALAATTLAARAAAAKLGEESRKLLEVASALAAKQRVAAELDAVAQLACGTGPTDTPGIVVSIPISTLTVLIGTTPPPLVPLNPAALTAAGD